MRAEIVPHQNDLARPREIPVRPIPKDRRVIGGGMPIGHLDVPPTLQRSEQHEDIGGAVALILVIDACWSAALHRHCHTGFPDQLLRGLIKTNQKPVRIPRPRLNLQTLFHRRHERRVGR